MLKLGNIGCSYNSPWQKKVIIKGAKKSWLFFFFFVTANAKSGTEIVITTRYAAPKRAREEKAAWQWAWKKERKGLGLESLRAQSGLRLHQRALMKNPSWRERKIQCSLEQNTRFLRAQFVEAPSSQQCILKLCSFAREVYANDISEACFFFFRRLDRSCIGARNDGHLPKPGGWRNGLNDPRHQHDQGERATQRGAGPGQSRGETRSVPETSVFLRRSHRHGHPGELGEAPDSVRHLSIYHQQVSILWEK